MNDPYYNAELVQDVINMLRQDKDVTIEFCSPNYIADYCCNRGILLTSREVVEISNKV